MKNFADWVKIVRNFLLNYVIFFFNWVNSFENYVKSFFLMSEILLKIA